MNALMFLLPFSNLTKYEVGKNACIKPFAVLFFSIQTIFFVGLSSVVGNEGDENVWMDGKVRVKMQVEGIHGRITESP